MKILKTFSRLFVGIVFLFSGFVKALDPLGSTYKFSDYFTAFNIGFLEPLAFPLAILLSAAELLIGFCLVTRLRMKYTSWLVLIFMAIFTPVTLVLAINNPVTDCGCFGDAITLTNWQTFWKNIILLVFTLVVFIQRKNFKKQYEPLVEWLLAGSFFMAIIAFSVYSYQHLPVLDFRPYKIGVNIPEGMTIPEDAEPNIYETILIYEKDGIVKEFTEENYPWQDTTWKWVETKSVLIQKGYEPPIHDFSITSLEGFDITDEFLQYEGYSFLIVAYDLSKSDKEALKELNDIALAADEKNIPVYCLTSSTEEEIDAIRSEIPLAYNIYTADEITLKTIIRSNPGLVMLNDATIIGKWHCNDLPEAETFKEENLLAFGVSSLRENRDNILIFMYIFLFLFALVWVKDVLRKKY
jgi:uncharacterized membrane protein YphA (DoxX/SURF4 family)